MQEFDINTIEIQTWVSVIYDVYEGGNWFIGKVIRKNPEKNTIKVKFLHQKDGEQKDIFYWPTLQDVDTVDTKFVFFKNVAVKEEGKEFKVSQCAEIEDRAVQYVQTFGS